MNELFVLLGIEHWKPVLRGIFFPPLPFLVMVALGLALFGRRRRLAWTLAATGLLGTWATCTTAVGYALIDGLTRPPPPMSTSVMTGLARGPKTAIVVLGAGRRLLAPEYGVAELTSMGNERLRYGVWLSRQTGLPLAFSGGVGLGSDPGPAEAEIARRVTARDFGVRLAWVEDQSRDTHENAIRSVAMLGAEGITRIVLVTHDFHMRRAVAAFERAIARDRRHIVLLAAPMGQRYPGGGLEVMDFLPSVEGYTATRLALHEWFGRLAGA